MSFPASLSSRALAAMAKVAEVAILLIRSESFGFIVKQILLVSCPFLASV